MKPTGTDAVNPNPEGRSTLATRDASNCVMKATSLAEMASPYGRPASGAENWITPAGWVRPGWDAVSRRGRRGVAAYHPPPRPPRQVGLPPPETTCFTLSPPSPVYAQNARTRTLTVLQT